MLLQLRLVGHPRSIGRELCCDGRIDGTRDIVIGQQGS